MLVAHAPSKAKLAADEGGPAGNMAFIPIFTQPAGVPTLVRAASPLSTNLAESRWKHRGAEVAHALLRAASALMPTPRDRENIECRQECRHSTQECVRHQQSRPPSPAQQKVCGARDVPGRDRPPLLATPPYSRHSEAATRVSLRHARVRAPHQTRPASIWVFWKRCLPGLAGLYIIFGGSFVL